MLQPSGVQLKEDYDGFTVIEVYANHPCTLRIPDNELKHMAMSIELHALIKGAQVAESMRMTL